MSIEINLKSIRKNLNLSIPAASLKCKVSRSYISEIESGKKSPTLNIIKKLAAGLECSVSDLIDDTPEKRGVAQ